MDPVAGNHSPCCWCDDHISRIPCEKLLKIDRLWIKYSSGKFGFSVQEKILSTFYDGTTPSGYYANDYRDSRYKLFASQLGWNNDYQELNKSPLPNLNIPPEGHFPSLLWALEGMHSSKPRTNALFRVDYMLKHIHKCRL